MAEFTDNNRNMTLSTKTTINDKMELVRLAEKYGVTLSEFNYTILMSFKNQYEYIGKDNPEVDKLKEEIRKLKSKNTRLETNLENADYRVQMEMDGVVKIRNEYDDCKYQLKEALAEKADLLTKLEKIQSDLSKANEKIESQSATIKDENLQKVGIGLFSVALTAFGINLSRK